MTGEWVIVILRGNFPIDRLRPWSGQNPSGGWGRTEMGGCPLAPCWLRPWERATVAVASHVKSDLHEHANGCHKKRASSASSAAHSSNIRILLHKTRACDNWQLWLHFCFQALSGRIDHFGASAAVHRAVPHQSPLTNRSKRFHCRTCRCLTATRCSCRHLIRA